VRRKVLRMDWRGNSWRIRFRPILRLSGHRLVRTVFRRCCRRPIGLWPVVRLIHLGTRARGCRRRLIIALR
jgi:hypothetical protein